MFTGIIEKCGKVTRAERTQDALRAWIETGFTDLELGESVAERLHKAVDLVAKGIV